MCVTQVVRERTWDGVNDKRPSRSTIDAHPSQRHLPDPNDEQHRPAIEYWMKFADFYQWPNIEYYESIDELVEKLNTISAAKLMEISRKMSEFNAQLKHDVINQWKAILLNIAENSPNKPH
jgi:hypothetical protein